MIITFSCNAQKTCYFFEWVARPETLSITISRCVLYFSLKLLWYKFNSVESVSFNLAVFDPDLNCSNKSSKLFVTLDNENLHHKKKMTEFQLLLQHLIQFQKPIQPFSKHKKITNLYVLNKSCLSTLRSTYNKYISCKFSIATAICHFETLNIILSTITTKNKKTLQSFWS